MVDNSRYGLDTLRSAAERERDAEAALGVLLSDPLGKNALRRLKKKAPELFRSRPGPILGRGKVGQQTRARGRPPKYRADYWEKVEALERVLQLIVERHYADNLIEAAKWLLRKEYAWASEPLINKHVQEWMPEIYKVRRRRKAKAIKE